MLLIGNGVVVTRDESNPLITNGAVAINKNKIVAVGKTTELKTFYKDYKFIDANGNLIMPGLINTHMHYYSTFARGINNNSPNPTKFSEILKGLWWRLDKSLTLEDVYYSSITQMIDQIRNGVTTVFDHHASPYSIRGSLFKIADAAERVGIRSNLCYETSDRDGEKIAIDGIEENVEFLKHCNNKKDDMLKGMFGLHASMTISEKTLYSCIEEANSLNAGFHVHCAEGIEDVIHCKDKYGKGVINRWYDSGLLNNKTIAVHSIHISDDEINMLKEKDTIVVHNPESNMGNAVGCSNIIKLFKNNILLGLGTDGYTTDMFESYKVGNLIHKHNLKDSTVAWKELPHMLFNNNRVITERFIDNQIGILKTGALADIIIVEYNPPTKINKDNINSHLLFGVSGKNTITTIIDGKLLMDNRKLIEIDEEEIFAKSRELSEELWKRF